MPGKCTKNNTRRQTVFRGMYHEVTKFNQGKRKSKKQDENVERKDYKYFKNPCLKHLKKNLALNTSQTQGVEMKRERHNGLLIAKWKKWRSFKNIQNGDYFNRYFRDTIGLSKCIDCNFIYEVGNIADEMVHSRIHSNLEDLQYNILENERVIKQFKQSRILEITFFDEKQFLFVAEKVLNVIDKELGFPENTFRWTADRKVYLYICKVSKIIAGCLVAEKCTRANRMVSSHVDISLCSDVFFPCKMGIMRVWTLQSYRRRKIATRLFEAACSSFLNVVLDVNLIAFSDPSFDGKAFAKHIFKRDDFLVYNSSLYF